MQLICTGQKALLPPTKPPQCRNNKQVFHIPVKIAEKPRGVLAEWLTLSKPTVLGLCPQRLGVNKASLSGFFLGGFVWGFFWYEITKHIFIRSS